MTEDERERGRVIDSSLERRVPERTSKGFDSLLDSTIQTSMRDLLGESSMKAIIFHLNLESPGSDPYEFHLRLYGLLSSPAMIVEEIIVKDLFKSINLMYAPAGSFDFARYAGSAKEFYLRQAKKGVG